MKELSQEFRVRLQQEMVRREEVEEEMNKQVGENTAGQEVGEGGKGGDRGKGGKGGKGGKEEKRKRRKRRKKRRR